MKRLGEAAGRLVHGDALFKPAQTLAICGEGGQPFSIQFLIVTELDDVLRLPRRGRRVSVHRLRADGYALARHDVTTILRVIEEHMARCIHELERPRRRAAHTTDRLPPCLARRQRDARIEQRATVLLHAHPRARQVMRHVQSERKLRAFVDALAIQDRIDRRSRDPANVANGQPVFRESHGVLRLEERVRLLIPEESCLQLDVRAVVV